MKKKVLFALIALFSFVSTWAADVVKVGNYDVTLSQKVVELVGETAAAPAISSVKKGAATVATNPTAALLDVNGAPITEITAVGNYFLKIAVDSKTLYVPFQVAKAAAQNVDFDFVWNESTWTAAKLRGLSLYLTANPSECRWNTAKKRGAWFGDINEQAGVAAWNDIPSDNADYPQNWLGAVYQLNTGGTLPWIVTYFNNSNSEDAVTVVFQYDSENYMPWGGTVFGKGPDSRKWGVCSVYGNDFLNDESYALAKHATQKVQDEAGVGASVPMLAGDNPNELSGLVTDDPLKFDISKFKMLLAPASNSTLLNLTLDSYQTTYNGSNTAEPILTVTYDGEAIDLKDDSQTSGNTPSQNDNDGYTVTVTKDGAAVTSYAAAGTYLIKVEYQGAVAFAEYQVNKFALSVGLGNLTKEYGEADPTEPVYAIVYSNVPTGDDIVIKGQTIKRTSNDTPNFANELPGTQIQYTVYGDAYVEDNESYIVSVTSTSGWMQVEKKVVNDKEFMVEVEDDALIYDKSEKEPAVHVYRRFVTGEDTEGNPTYGEWDKTNDLANQFEVTYANNINADAYGKPRLQGTESVYDWMTNVEQANRATATVTPKAISPFMEIADDATTTEVDESSKISAQEFKIRQRQIVAGDVSAVADQTFNNQDQTPAVTVKFENANLTPTTVTLAEGTDYTIVFTDNKWVTDEAKYKVEAKYTEAEPVAPATEGEHIYTGNYWDAVNKTFKITTFKFAIQAEDNSKAFGEEDPALTVKTVDPTTGEAKALPTDVQLSDILKQNADESYYHVTRVPGEHVGAYVISVTDAELKGNAATAGDPAHNYELTGLIPGAFTIVKADNLYYVSSKKVEKEYDGTADVNGPDNKYFNGYYLYKRVRPGNGRNSFEEILPTDPVYSLIAGPTQNVLNDTRTGAGINVYWSNGVGSTIYSWNILPDVTGLSTDEYTLATIDLHAGSGEHDGEGYLQVNPKTVFLVADDQTSVYGEPLVVPATADTKVYGYKLEGTQKVIDKDQLLTVTLNFRAPVVTGVTNTPAEVPYTFGGTIAVPNNYTNNQTVAQANANYDIHLVAGNYTVTAPTEAIKVAVTWTKSFGQTDAQATATYQISHPNKVSYTLAANEIPQLQRGNGALEAVNTEGYVLAANQMIVPEKLDGLYDAEFTGKLIILPLGEVTIALNNQTINYDGADAVKTLVAPYASVTGLDADQIAEFGLEITYTKPETGFIKDGAKLQVKCGNVSLGEPGEGHVVTAAEWPWVENFTKVTVKSAKLYVNAADEITLDIVSFSPTNYNAEKDGADQLIRDYDGSDVKKVNLVCSGESFEIADNKWYSLVLPFATSARQISKALNGYAVIDVLDNSDKSHATRGEDIRFTINVGEVPANTPFIFKVDETWNFPQAVSATVNFAADKITIAYPGEDFKWPADQNGNQFIGTYQALYGINSTAAAANDDNKILNREKNLIVNNAGNISPASNTAYLRPLGAYVQMANGYSAANARIFIEEADGTTTVIEGVDAEGAEVAYGEGWYTITGVKLDAEPTTTGTYIFNGKKVFIQK